MSTKLASMIRDGASAPEIAAFLDGLDDDARVAEIYTLGHSDQKKVWELAADNGPLSMQSFLPTTDQPTIYRGRNNLIAFERFEKHFYRPADGSTVFGYNLNTPLVAWFAGPGYFSVSEDNGLIVFDYTKVPSLQLAEWPKIEINERGFGPRVVYGYMTDYNRKVSERVVIGQARKKDKIMGAYYMVSRVDR